MPRQRPLRVSVTELDVLRVLWQKGPSTLGEVFQQLAEQHAYTTVQTILDRLVQKGLVARDRTARPARHRAKLTRSRVMRHYLGLLLDRVCSGPGPLVMHLLEDASFTAEELTEIRRMLDEAKPSARREPDLPG